MSIQQTEENVISPLYENYSETQKEILAIEIRKTRIKLFTIAVVVFLFNLLSLVMADALTLSMLIWILITPAIIVGLAFLAIKEPLVAMIIAAVLIVGFWVYAIIATAGVAALSGWLSKAIIVYLLFAGFQNAREATRIKKELRGM